MKNIVLFCMLISLPFLVKAQDEGFETIGKGKENGKVKVSGFAGPAMAFTSIDGTFAHMMGGGAGVIINNFFLGGYGMGKTTEMVYKNDPSYVMTYGHGGFWLGYTFKPNKAIHPVVHTQLGWGSIGKRPKDFDFETDPTNIDRVFVVCPTFELEMNFSHFFKVGAGVNYSFVYNTGSAISPYTFDDFSNAGVFLSLKFGWFK